MTGEPKLPRNIRLSVKDAMSAGNLKRRVTGFLLLSLVCALVVSDAQSERSGRPENLRFVQPYLWLGYVSPDQSVPFTFDIKNDSDEAVKIVSAEASCRCTSPEGKVPEEIPRHGTGSFKWIFSAARSAGGFESKEITITTADGKDLVGKFEAWVGNPDDATAKPAAKATGR